MMVDDVPWTDGENEPQQETGRFQPSRDAVAKRLEDEVVLVQLGTNQIYKLNRTGARLWELLEQSHDLESAREQMLLEFDVGEEPLRDEIRVLVNDLVEKGLLDRDADG
jgi:hypothetical protein